MRSYRCKHDGEGLLLPEESDARIQMRDVDQHVWFQAKAFVGFAIPAQSEFVSGSGGEKLPA